MKRVLAALAAGLVMIAAVLPFALYDRAVRVGEVEAFGALPTAFLSGGSVLVGAIIAQALYKRLSR